jgi:hypothetical protein
VLVVYDTAETESVEQTEMTADELARAAAAPGVARFVTSGVARLAILSVGKHLNSALAKPRGLRGRPGAKSLSRPPRSNSGSPRRNTRRLADSTESSIDYVPAGATSMTWLEQHADDAAV